MVPVCLTLRLPNVKVREDYVVSQATPFAERKGLVMLQLVSCH